MNVDLKALIPKQTRRNLTQYVKKEVKIYTDEEVEKLMAASRREYHKVLWLCTRSDSECKKLPNLVGYQLQGKNGERDIES
jgi:hypothetical protein